MSKQHRTFPGEQQEISPQPAQPEIERPRDPKEPEIPEEDTQIVPDEYPPGENSPESPLAPPAKPE